MVALPDDERFLTADEVISRVEGIGEELTDMSVRVLRLGLVTESEKIKDLGTHFAGMAAGARMQMRWSREFNKERHYAKEDTDKGHP